MFGRVFHNLAHIPKKGEMLALLWIEHRGKLQWKPDRLLICPSRNKAPWKIVKHPRWWCLRHSSHENYKKLAVVTSSQGTRMGSTYPVTGCKAEECYTNTESLQIHAPTTDDGRVHASVLLCQSRAVRTALCLPMQHPPRLPASSPKTATPVLAVIILLKTKQMRP